MASDENESVVDDDLTTFDFEDQDDLEFDDDDAPAGSDNGSADSSSPNESDSNAASDSSDDSKDGGDKPAKRRRRRRRRSSNRDKGESNQPSGKKSQGRQQQKGGARGGQQQRKGKFARNAPPPPEAVTSGVIEGVLELHPKGYGFLRDKENDYGARETDAFVSSTFVEKHQLREGIMIRGEVGPGTRGQGPRLLNIESIDGGTVEEYEQIKHFETLTPINPFEQIKLEIGPEPITMRVMDLLTPIGKGQRALIVAPPRSGKTMLLQDIANSVSINHPEIHLIVLLIDERPEEVTELRRMVRGEVIASSMDRDVESHVRISQLIHERGKRLAEAGKDCFILMDSITRTARAFNKWVGNSGRTGTGGLDVKAMDIPRKMFGTARRFDEGGSLTVAATALIDTGSRMDEAIFQEFKGTGNMELVLSRDLADRRIWPAIDISKSGTRREEKILAPEVLEGVIMLRRALVSMSPVDAMTELTRKLQMFPTNSEFLERVRSVL
ncbi:MAG: transcription termination factor Rho [Maioricimonas sp. JB045]